MDEIKRHGWGNYCQYINVNLKINDTNRNKVHYVNNYCKFLLTSSGEWPTIVFESCPRKQ
jgi:hypothetical protein